MDSQQWPDLDALLQVAEVRDRLGTNIEVVETDPDAFRKEVRSSRLLVPGLVTHVYITSWRTVWRPAPSGLWTIGR